MDFCGVVVELDPVEPVEPEGVGVLPVPTAPACVVVPAGPGTAELVVTGFDVLV